MLRSKPATISAVTSTTCHPLIQSKNPTARAYNKKLSAPLWGAYLAGRRLGHHEGYWSDFYAPDSDGRACYRQLRRITLPRTSVHKGRGTVPPVPATEEQASEPSHAYKPTLVFKLLPQQLHRPLSEEVECVAVGVLLADVELRVLVSYQRAFLDEVVQGALVTIRAVAYG